MKMRALLALMSVLLVVVSASLYSEAHALELRELIHTRTLGNGLDVIVIPDPSVPIVTIELAVKNGAFTETEELNGLSHLYEHMFFKGNAVIPNQEAYLKRMRELGISFNGTTSTERVNYFFTLPSDNLVDGLVFMYDATVSPTFDSEEFEKEKHVVTGELDRAESSPQFWLHQIMNELLWYEHPSRKNVIGKRETILAATIEQMQTMQKHYYVPNNSVILIAGDVDVDEAFAAVTRIFSPWKPGPDPHKTLPVPTHPPLPHNKYVVVEQPVQVPSVRLTWHGPSVTEDPTATYAADVLSYILSQPTSQFYKNLVESGVTLSAGLGYFTQRYIGPVYMSAEVEQDKLKDAIRAMLLEIPKLTNPDYFTDEQLQSAKTILQVQEIYGREKMSSFIHTVSFWWAVADLDYYFDYNVNLQAVTRDDIARYVSEYVLDKPFVMGVLISPEARDELGVSEEELQRIVEEVRLELASK